MDNQQNDNDINSSNDLQFNKSDLMRPMEPLIQQNNQNISTNVIEQQNSYNNNTSMNTTSNNTLNNQILTSSLANISNSNSKSFLQGNKNKIIIGVGIIFVLGILLTMYIRKGSSMNNGYTASKGSILKINEIVDKFNVNVTSPLEKSIITDNILYDGDCLKLGISVSNLYKDTLDISITVFSLTDSNKTDIYTADPFYSSQDNILRMNFESGESKNGYLFFTESSYEDDKLISTLDLNSIKYLKVSVINSASKDGSGTYHYSYEDYYLEL